MRLSGLPIIVLSLAACDSADIGHLKFLDIVVLVSECRLRVYLVTAAEGNGRDRRLVRGWRPGVLKHSQPVTRAPDCLQVRARLRTDHKCFSRSAKVIPTMDMYMFMTRTYEAT
jgi:hypothetical protein